MSEISRAGVALSQQEIDRLIKKGDRNPPKESAGRSCVVAPRRNFHGIPVRLSGAYVVVDEC